MTSRRVPAALAVLALALAGCGGNGGDQAEPPPATEPATQPGTGAATEPEEPAEPGDAEDELAEACTNDEYGFAVRYPEGWYTNDGDVLPACSFFHPEPFAIPEGTEAVDFAVMARREPVALDRIVGGDLGTDVLEREDVELAGRAAVRRETESTGEGLFPQGLRATQYLVDLDGETLVLETYDVETLDYDRNVAVLDQMVATLELLPGGA